jgi:FkbM family methyltransferase
MPKWRERVSTAIIRVGRRLIANTPIQRLPLTTAIYRKVFRLGYPAAEVTTPFRDSTLTVPTDDVTLVPGLIGGYYEQIELDVFDLMCRTSLVVVDVGANVGLFSCLAAARVREGGRVVAFEPIPANLRYLRRNIEQNGYSERVVIEATAVGEDVGSVDVFMVRGSIGTHSISAKNAANSTESVSVPMTTLDTYAEEHGLGRIDALKVDVEGYEGHVLRGATAVLKQHRPSLFVEFVPAHLSNCGFEPRELIDIVLSTYGDVFLVDEPRSVIRRITRQELLDAGLNHKNLNLIAVDAAAHPEHLEAVESVALSR